MIPGQGVIGLGWAFLRAGAHGIVVSEWTVDDVAAAKLMVDFHRHLHARTEPITALSLARRTRALEGAASLIGGQEERSVPLCPSCGEALVGDGAQVLAGTERCEFCGCKVEIAADGRA